MTVKYQRSGMPLASVQLWGKGFRVTEDTEEFQRYVPLEGPLDSLESGLAATHWGRALEPLYSLSLRELSTQRCVLFNADSLMAVAFAPTEDRHGRPSLVLTTATIPIAWGAESLGSHVGRAVSLAARLAGSYAEALRRNPPPVEKQLRSATFLRSRRFELGDELQDTGVEWDRAMASVKLWRGIAGLCTPRMAALGANVVFGTRHEAESAKRLHEVDGYFDVRDGEIRPLSTRLDRWTKAEQPTPAQPSVPTPDFSGQPPDLAPIAESLQRIERTLDRLADMGGRIVDVGVRLLDHVLRDKRKR